MKRIALSLFVLSLFAGGCTSSMSSITGTDTSMVSQVPKAQLAEVDKARLALRIAEETVKISELHETLTGFEDKLAGYNYDLAKNDRDLKENDLKTAELAAISKAGLGVPEDNAKNMDSLRQKDIDIKAKAIRIRADIDQTTLRVQDTQKRIQEQQNVINRLEAKLNGEDKPVVEAAPVPVKEAAPVAPVVAPAAAPEAAPAEAPKAAEAPKKDVELPDYLKVEKAPEEGNNGAIEMDVPVDGNKLDN